MSITQEISRSRFYYNPLTGLFYRRWKNLSKPTGTLASTGYIVIGLDHKLYSAHRLAWLYTYGCMPDECIDHINRDKTDNRLSNLREVTYSENNRNLKLNSRNTSGFHGISFCRRRGKWLAEIGVDGTTERLGAFEFMDDAIEARTQAEVKYDFHPNHGQPTIPSNYHEMA